MCDRCLYATIHAWIIIIPFEGELRVPREVSRAVQFGVLRPSQSALGGFVENWAGMYI